MEENDAIRDLMAKLMAAVETSLSSSTAVREALADLVRQGYEAKLFFVANAGSANGENDGDRDAATSRAPRDDADDEAPLLREIGAVVDDGDLQFELTKLDRDFLKSLNIRPESG